MVECRAQMIISTTINPGGMAEWTKAVVLKTTVGETSPGVRIPLLRHSNKTGRCRSGRSGPPAKWLSGLNSTEGSNPSLPASAIQ